jgi:hypothetical protein
MQLINIIDIATQKGVLPEDFIDELWNIQAQIHDKVRMSLELFDIQPTYHVLTTMWRNYYPAAERESITAIILKKYFDELSDSRKDLADSMEYSLYFDIFEEPNLNGYSWVYFLKQNPAQHFLGIMLRNSGPVPYYLKHALYQQLLPDTNIHADIYKSIRHSCFDNCGSVDKVQALKIFNQLDLGAEIDRLNSEIGFPDIEAVVKYLNGNSG